MMKCLSCKEESGRDVGTCHECYEEAGETEEELKREIKDLKTKVNFLRLHTVVAGPNYTTPRPNAPSFSDVVLVASDSAEPHPTFPPIPAHRAVLVERPSNSACEKGFNMPAREERVARRSDFDRYTPGGFNDLRPSRIPEHDRMVI